MAIVFQQLVHWAINIIQGFLTKLNDSNVFCQGTPPQDGDVRVGKRFVHKRDADYGAILTRHYANSLKDCLRLCQWATATQ